MGTTETDHDGVSKLTVAVNRLAAAFEREVSPHAALGTSSGSRYTRSAADTTEFVGKKMMPELLNISQRTLASHRRVGRLLNCWTKNGRKIAWHVQETRDAWKRGIA